MAFISYPDTLPAPQRWLGVPRERRAVSAMAGNTQHRGRSLDRVEDIDAQWTYEPEQMEAWVTWFKDTLINGQRWFAATVPGVGGWISRAVRYRTGSLRKEHLGFGIYRITARMEQRGRAVPPELGLFLGPLILLKFDDAASGTQVFTDEGYGEAVWTPSGAGVVLSDVQEIAGRSLRIPTDTSYLRADYNENIALLDEDFEIQFDAWADGGNVYGRDWIGIVQPDGYVGAWEFYTGLLGGLGPGRMWFFWRDQGGAEHSIRSGIAMPISAWVRYKAKRVGSTVSLWQDDVQVASKTYTGSLRHAEGMTVSIGKNPNDVSVLGKGKACYIDNVIVVRGPGSVDDFL